MLTNNRENSIYLKDDEKCHLIDYKKYTFIVNSVLLETLHLLNIRKTDQLIQCLNS